MEALRFLGCLSSEHCVFGSSELFINLLALLMGFRWQKSILSVPRIRWGIHFIQFALIDPSLPIEDSVVFLYLEQGVVQHGGLRLDDRLDEFVVDGLQFGG